jgi:hypothetical protein
VHLDRARLVRLSISSDRKAADAAVAAGARAQDEICRLRKQNASLAAAVIKQRVKSEGAAVLLKHPTVKFKRKMKHVVSDAAAACGRLELRVDRIEQQAASVAACPAPAPALLIIPPQQSRKNSQRSRKRARIATATATPLAVPAAAAVAAGAPLPGDQVQQIAAAVAAALPVAPAHSPREAARAFGVFKAKSRHRGKVIKQMACDWRAGAQPPPPDTHYQPRLNHRGKKRHRTQGRDRQPAQPHNHLHRRSSERALQYGPPRFGCAGFGSGGAKRH